MKLNKASLVLTALTAIVFSCASPLSTGRVALNDISKQIGYSHLRAMAYMGGSVYFDPQNLEASQLVAGVQVAFRLGRVEKIEVAADHVVFKDTPAKAQFGTIAVDTVTADGISFSYQLYDSSGNLGPAGVRSLSEGEIADLDGDTLGDVTYTNPKSHRPGFEQARFLTFLSSQETQRTSMFALIPQQYADAQYPNGVMGINPNGRFLVAKYRSGSGQRTMVSGVVAGDFVLDSQIGRYERVVGNPGLGGARSLDDSQLQNIEATVPTSFLYRGEEFAGSYRAIDLLKALPATLQGFRVEDLPESAAVDALNAILKTSEMIPQLAGSGINPIPAEAFPMVLQGLPALNQAQLIQLNRLYLEKSYPELSPTVSQADNPISEVLPLLSCEIRNPEVNSEAADPTLGRSLGTALSPKEYDSQRAAIEKKWGAYQPIFAFDLGPGGGKVINVIYDFLASGKIQQAWDFTASLFSNKTPPQPDVPAGEQMVMRKVDANGQIIQPEPTPAMVTKAYFNVDAQGKVPGWNDITSGFVNPAQTFKIQLGLYGNFSCSWGNIEGGIAIGLFVQADNKFIVSAGVSKKALPGASGNGMISMTQPTGIGLTLGSLPPIQIGVVNLTLSLAGGFDIPFSFGANMDLSMGLRMAFTGLYGAEVHAGVNYGVRWGTVRVMWWDVSVPVGGYADMYGGGSVINDTAFYIGPSDFLINQSVVPWVDSAGVFIAVTPSVYIEPRVTFNGVLYIGVKGSVGDLQRLDLTMGHSVVSGGLSYPTVHGSMTTKPTASLDATYGASVLIPLVNWNWSPSGSTSIWHSDFPSITTPLF